MSIFGISREELDFELNRLRRELTHEMRLIKNPPKFKEGDFVTINKPNRPKISGEIIRIIPTKYCGLCPPSTLWNYEILISKRFRDDSMVANADVYNEEILTPMKTKR